MLAIHCDNNTVHSHGDKNDSGPPHPPLLHFLNLLIMVDNSQQLSCCPLSNGAGRAMTD